MVEIQRIGEKQEPKRHLPARLFRQGPKKYRTRRLDALAGLACIELPGWANGSLALEGNLTLESHLFYAWFTGFNLLVLCLIAIPRAHGFVFGAGWHEAS